MTERERIVRTIAEALVVLALIGALIASHDHAVQLTLMGLLGGLAGSRTAARGARSVIAGAADARAKASTYPSALVPTMLGPMASVAPYPVDVTVSEAPPSIGGMASALATANAGGVLESVPPPEASPIPMAGAGLVVAGAKDALRGRDEKK